MRVLFYNWVDHDDPQKRGGGVALYQRNLVDALAAIEGVQTGSLSAGLAHDLRPGAPPRRARIGKRAAPGGHQAHEIVNSGLLSPAHADFGSPAQLSHDATEQVFGDALRRTGPWDVVHFNNLEGLPAHALAQARAAGAGRVILSLHNYYPFCPQVNLWREERAHCTDFHDGQRCVSCLPVKPNRQATRMALALSWRLGHLRGLPGGRMAGGLLWALLRLGWHGYKRLRGATLATPADPAPPQAAPPTAAPRTAQYAADAAHGFAERRARMVALINAECDAVLCVSDRVRQIARHYGIRPEILHTAYIGTREARHWQHTRPAPQFLAPDGTLHLAYLGYMRADKGFPFLLDALSALPDATLARLRLTVAARSGPAPLMARMAALAPRLAGFRHLDGYNHETLDSVLDGVALGVVPVMWQDNLPQVAIEMHARHIPLLTSDMGGAQELGRCPALVFRAGDKADFARALDGVLSGAVQPADYWPGAMAPVTMADHLDQLLPIYRGAPAG